MLVLAGLGLFDEKDITLREIEEAKSADKVFIETYTNIWHGSLNNLEKIIGKGINTLKRIDLEENSSKLIEMARDQKIVVFVPGDPLVATTHAALLSECIKKGIKFKVLHNASIVSAVSESGLHFYRFGATVTIPSKEKLNIPSRSVYETIKKNLECNYHTLCLLDIGLSVKDGINYLDEMEKSFGKILPEKIIVLSLLGSPRKKIVYGSREKIKALEFDLPSVLIIPSSLHFSEKEYISNFLI